MVIVYDLAVILQDKKILKNVSCTLLPGRITTFIGKSGAGKTTILQSIVGLMPIQNGTVLVNDTSIVSLSSQQRAQEIGYVFQDFNLFPHLSVLQNCIDSLIVHGLSVDKARQRVDEVLEQLDMQDFKNSYPDQLSGGQKQRVAIARALCLQPKVLLLDEPTASLDPINTALLINMLQKLAAGGLTVGVSSQDMTFVRMIADRVYYVQAGTIVELYDEKNNIDGCPLMKYLS